MVKSKGKVKLVLASASPRRRMLLKKLGLRFTVRRANIQEKRLRGERARPFTLRMAKEKAKTIIGTLKDASFCIVLGSDTVVVLSQGSSRERILGKPRNRKEAEGMLKSLSGRTHQVITAYCLIHPKGEISGSVKTRVTFRKMTKPEISNYVTTGEPMDKAGAYGIQEHGGIFVENIVGSYSNVVGLPLVEVHRALQAAYWKGFGEKI